MGIKEDFFDDILVETVLHERATIAEAEVLKKQIAAKYAEGYKKIIIDLSECEFIDSTFLGVIVNTLKRVAKVNGDLKLVGFKPAVKSMFELTRMFRVFESFTSVREAIKSFE